MHGKKFLNRSSLSVLACALAMAAPTAARNSAPPAPVHDEMPSIDAIQRYCTTSWRNARIAPQDWTDCTQEVFVRLLDRLPRDRISAAIDDSASEERRELNRSIWSTARRWQRRPRMLTNDSDVADRPSESGRESSCVEDVIDSIGAELNGVDAPELSPRQRHILTQWSLGATIAEIGEELDLLPARVSDEKFKALRKLRRRFASANA